MSHSTIERMQWTPLSYEIVDIYIMSLSTGLRFCLKASSSGLENQPHASADPSEGPVIVKQRLWHNECFPRLTAWQCILDDGSGWFLDVDVCHHQHPPRFLSFLDRSRKHEQPRWEWWEFLAGAHTFHLPYRENLFLEVQNRPNEMIDFNHRPILEVWTIPKKDSVRIWDITFAVPGPSLEMAHKRS